MRTAFIKTLEKLAAIDDKIFLIVGDLGFGVTNSFSENLPKQFLNSGIAEQNMTGIAAGMAMTGKTVITYSIANFPTIRPYEQIRNDVCYHNADVKIVAVGGGFCYGALGPTHFATEDLAVMRVLPNITVLAPGDPWEASAATEAMIKHKGPVYLRLGRAGEPFVHKGEVDFKIGKAIKIKEGQDVTIFAIGGMVYNSLMASEILEKNGISVRLISMGSLKPLDEECIINSAKNTRAIITVEEHSVIGGLGSAVSEVLCEAGINVPFKRLGIPSEFPERVGDQEWFLAKYKLTDEGIANSILELLNKSN
jgi:transketolase